MWPHTFRPTGALPHTGRTSQTCRQEKLRVVCNYSVKCLNAVTIDGVLVDNQTAGPGRTNLLCKLSYHLINLVTIENYPPHTHTMYQALNPGRVSVRVGYHYQLRAVGDPKVICGGERMCACPSQTPWSGRVWPPLLIPSQPSAGFISAFPDHRYEGWHHPEGGHAQGLPAV